MMQTFRKASIACVCSLALLGFVSGQNIEEPAVRLAEVRYVEAMARLDAQNAKQRATEAKRVLEACRPLLQKAVKSSTLDRAVALKERVDFYELISGERNPAVKNRVQFGGHTYALFADKVSWHVAKWACEAMGGYLACVESKEEDQFINQLCNGKDAWLGGTDEEWEGDWRWVNGAPMKYKNARFDNLGIQHHMIYYAAGNRWDVESAGQRLGFVCEWEH